LLLTPRRAALDQGP